MLWVTLPLCRLSHKRLGDYSTVVTPLSTILPNFSRPLRAGLAPCGAGLSGGNQEAGLDLPIPSRLDTDPALHPLPRLPPNRCPTIRSDPCVLEVDSGVNCTNVLGNSPCTNVASLWGCCGEKPARATGNRQCDATAAVSDVTVTGIAERTPFPESGSITASSVRMFEFTPGFSAATERRVPGTP